MTNSEKIRNMPDEELALFLNEVICKEINIKGICKDNWCMERYCTDCTLEWLKSEAE